MYIQLITGIQNANIYYSPIFFVSYMCIACIVFYITNKRILSQNTVFMALSQFETEKIKKIITSEYSNPSKMNYIVLYSFIFIILPILALIAWEFYHSFIVENTAISLEYLSNITFSNIREWYFLEIYYGYTLAILFYSSLRLSQLNHRLNLKDYAIFNLERFQNISKLTWYTGTKHKHIALFFFIMALFSLIDTFLYLSFYMFVLDLRGYRTNKNVSKAIIQSHA